MIVRRFIQAFLVAVLVSGSALAQSGKPLAESLSQKARPLYDAGVALYKKSDWAGALAQFTAAYAAEPDPRLLWNMSACEKSLGHHAAAHALVRRYLDESKGSISERDKKEAEAFSAVLGAMFAPVTLESEPAGALVSADGREVGRTPMILNVDMGERVFKLTLEGRKPFERKETVTATSSRTIRAVLEPYSATLRITTRPPASMLLDGKSIGIGSFSGSVDAGDHLLDASAKGYVTQHAKLTLRPDEQRVLELPLEPIPSKPMLWPWFVAAGVAVAAGLVVGGYFLFRVERTTPAPGTLGAFPLP